MRDNRAYRRGLRRVMEMVVVLSVDEGVVVASKGGIVVKKEDIVGAVSMCKMGRRG